MAVQISGNDITVPRDGSFTRNVTIGGTLTYEDVTNIDSVGLVTARNGIEIGARPGVAASISVDGNMIISGITTLGTTILGDSDELRFGAGSDLSIFHNGNHSFIKDSGTGSLFVQTDTLKVENAAGDESMITATQDGAVQLYHNGNLKLATSSDGVDLGDNVKLRIGDAPDYKLYHNGSNTYHENYTGDLFIKSDQMYLTSWTSGETYLHAVKDGRVALYHDNSLKIETASHGVEITGKLTFANDNHLNGIELGADGDVVLYHDNSDAYFDNNTGDFYIRNAGSNPNQIYISGKGGENGIVVNGDAGVQLYNNDVMRFETNSSGAIVYGNTGNIFQATCATNSTASVVFQNTESNTAGDMRLLIKTAANQGSDPYIKFDAGGSDMIVGTHYLGSTSNQLRLGAGTAVHTVNGIQIDGNGNVYMNAINSGSGASDMRYNTSSKQVFYDSSSRLVKTDIEDLSYGLDAIKQLKPRIYKRTDTDGDIEVGFIADEVINIIPEIVPTAEKSLFTKNEEDTEIVPSYVEYKRLTAVLTKAVQELSTEIESLKSRLDDAGL